ncbi:NAD(P)/FAD-dependent oxidoreductase [Candidatus Obscuribacterales bacterium]|nr:NAD(P)/FAD-dependent oxidoreductase [Candidatus Obscuribacterales bacterium]
MKTSFDAVVIGAGGAGMMCAATAGKLGKKVLLVDHATVVGRKILISGGGRCNFTNLYATAENYVSQNPHFIKSALARYTPGDFIELVERHGIPYHEKKLGQQFCDNSAQDIVDLLIAECDDAGVEFKLGCDVKAIVAPPELGLDVFDNRLLNGVKLSSNNVAEPGRYQIHTSKGTFDCASLVIATGGLSVPKVGATAFGYNVAKQFGLKVIETAPALDGFVFNENDSRRFYDLSGISQDSIVSCGDSSFRENILFTHRGLSGPASLQASLYWRQGAAVQIDLCPDTDIGAKLIEERATRSKKNVRNLLTEYLPIRLAHRICEDQGVDDSIQHISDKTIQQLAEAVKEFVFKPSSTVGYIKAEVTRGGVDTNALSSTTMGCKKIPGLFFIGEIVDVTGQLGGFNFQWAWASGYAAGNNV